MAKPDQLQLQADQANQAGAARAANDQAPIGDGLQALALKIERAEGAPIEGEGGAPGDAHLVDTAPAEPPAPSNAEVVTGMVTTIRETVLILQPLESLRDKLTDQVAAQLGALWGPVLDGYGIQLGRTMGRHAPAMVAAWSTFQLVGPIVQAVRAEVLALDRKPSSSSSSPAAIDAPTEAKPVAAAPPAANGPAFADGVVRPAF